MSEERDPNTETPTETPAEQPAETPAEQPAEETPTETPPAPQQSKSDWRDSEIRRLRAQNRELRAAQQQPTQPPSAPATPALDPSVEFQRLVREQAQQLAQQQNFNQRCNDCAAKGQEQFGPEFGQRVGGIQRLVDMNDPAQIETYNRFLDVAIETGEGPKILFELGADPNEAARVMALPVARMAVELAKMATTEGTSPTLSGATKPITPVTAARANRSPIDPSDPDKADTLSTAEWMRRRNEQAALLNGVGRR